ncbi:membrane protein US19 [Cercopithecine betaherpesvirus 5]|uniref:Membrane protein US19 n=1 Tax=Simian cytomegalovirus (strain Colburn) TaxID=50292 RepID=G8XTM5_SCMVC|nr:membrane protein US19 [Cercopithecine betaherpesvirus 5]AEV80517.1 membrane protein US19 [Cercopithecine betaherpesvirus 5]
MIPLKEVIYNDVFAFGRRIMFFLQMCGIVALQVTSTIIVGITYWFLFPGDLQEYCSHAPRFTALWLFVPMLSLFSLHLFGKHGRVNQFVLTFIYLIPNSLAMVMMVTCRSLDKLLLAGLVPVIIFTCGMTIVCITRIRPVTEGYHLHGWLFPVMLVTSALMIIALTIVPSSSIAWTGCYLALLLTFSAGLSIHDFAVAAQYEYLGEAVPMLIRLYVEILIMYITGLMIFDPVFWQTNHSSFFTFKLSRYNWWFASDSRT